jgi:hypothetical protein
VNVERVLLYYLSILLPLICICSSSGHNYLGKKKVPIEKIEDKQHTKVLMLCYYHKTSRNSSVVGSCPGCCGVSDSGLAVTVAAIKITATTITSVINTVIVFLHITLLIFFIKQLSLQQQF